MSAASDLSTPLDLAKLPKFTFLNVCDRQAGEAVLAYVNTMIKTGGLSESLRAREIEIIASSPKLVAKALQAYGERKTHPWSKKPIEF